MSSFFVSPDPSEAGPAVTSGLCSGVDSLAGPSGAPLPWKRWASYFQDSMFVFTVPGWFLLVSTCGQREGVIFKALSRRLRYLACLSLALLLFLLSISLCPLCAVI